MSEGAVLSAACIVTLEGPLLRLNISFIMEIEGFMSKRLKGVSWVLGLWLCFSMGLGVPEPSAANPPSASATKTPAAEPDKTVQSPKAILDIRILVESSLNMGLRDQTGLRETALKILTNLLPTGAQGSVWTFGRETRLLLKPAIIDNDWRFRVIKNSKIQDPVSPIVDLADGLMNVSRDWINPDPSQKKVIPMLIVLTDGQVYTSRSEQDNQEAKRHIAEEIIPFLKKNGIKIYTINLTKRADFEFLKKINQNGDMNTLQQMVSGKDLEQMYLQSFVSVIPPNELPLEKGRFFVDEQVQELTLMIFHENDPQPLRLINPNQVVYTFENAPDNFHWYHQDTFDVVSVYQPASGFWNLGNHQEGLNRAFISSSLKLKNNYVPQNVFVSEEFKINSYLENEGRTFTRRDVIGSMRFLLEQSLDRSPPQVFRYELNDAGKLADETPNDGKYSMKLIFLPQHVGLQHLIYKAESRYVKRLSRQVVAVHPSPIKVDVQVTQDNFEVTLKPIEDLVIPYNLRVLISIDDQAGNNKQFRLPPIGENKQWLLKLPASSGASYKIKMSVDGSTIDGRTFFAKVPPYLIKIANASGKIDVKQDMKPSPSDSNKNASEIKEDEDIFETKASIASLNEMDSLKLSEVKKKRSIGAMVLIVSSLMMMVLGVCVLVYWFVRKD